MIERLAGECDEREVTHQEPRMLVIFGGRERSRRDFDTLGRAAGLTLTQVQRVPSGRGVLSFRGATRR